MLNGRAVAHLPGLTRGSNGRRTMMLRLRPNGVTMVRYAHHLVGAA